MDEPILFQALQKYKEGTFTYEQLTNTESHVLHTLSEASKERYLALRKTYIGEASSNVGNQDVDYLTWGILGFLALMIFRRSR